MHWYFALSEGSIDRERHDWRNLIRVAVHSAKLHTALQPHLLYDGGENEFIEELRQSGVKVLFHRSSLYETLQRHRPDSEFYLSIASGAFLRFDIPLLETSDEYVLYTDCDVVFRAHPNFYGAASPKFFSATSQTQKIPSEDMNSGVMLINIAAMRAIHGELIAFTEENLHLGLDQEILRVFFRGRYTPMDMSLNWKPYWGPNPAAQIIHFHGPKPSATQPLDVAALKSFSASWHDLFTRNPDGYRHYGALWHELLESYGKDQEARNLGKMVDVLRTELRDMTADRDRWRALAEKKPPAPVFSEAPTARRLSWFKR